MSSRSANTLWSLRVSEAGSPRAAVGRGDLVRALIRLGEGGLTESARVLGFQRQAVPTREVSPSPEKSLPQESAAPSSETTPRPEAVTQVEPFPLWRVVQVDHRLDEPVDEASASSTPDPLRPGEQEVTDDVQEPLSPPIVAWPRLWRALDESLRRPWPRIEIDVDALVRDWSRGRVARELPRRSGLGHARVALIVDRSVRLQPFFLDQRRIVAELVQRLGPTRLRFLPPPSSTGPLPRLESDEMLVALSDVGFYGNSATIRSWRRWALHAGRRKQPCRALVPCPRHRWDRRLGRLWAALDWERPDSSAASAAPSPELLEQLMALLSVAVRVEPALLRRLRLLLDGGNLGMEADAWADDRVSVRSSVGIMLEPEAARGLRRVFAGLDPDLKEAAALEILEAHRHLPLEVRAEEAFNLLAAGIEESTLGKLLKDGIELIRRLTATLESGGEPSRWDRGLEAWLARFQGRISAGATAHERLREPLGQAQRVLRQRRPEALSAAGILPESFPPPQVSARRYVVHQTANGLWIEPTGPPPSPEEMKSSLVEIRAAEPRMTLGDDLRAAREISLEQQAGRVEGALPSVLTLTTDIESVTLEAWRPILDDTTSWASAAGRDEYGLWAAFEVEGVRQRMRWIPPGRFWMGSPEEEEGRFGDEGPRHAVTLTEGFWFAETPCTQALWRTVMGENPSKHEGDERPVGTVSWEDCQRFFDRLNERFRHLEARLPTEAEWEYACRAGTDSATWLGDLLNSEEGKAPLLDDIAWYHGNSGGKTHEVGLKEPNPWGLYDLLGNVDEWCWDAQDRYPSTEEVDPEGPDGGSERVFRGGSWGDRARYVRAACRLGYRPDVRNSYLGFRLSRGRGPVRGAERRQPGSVDARAARRGTSRRAGSRRSRAWVERLGWARDGGTDRFGRWASFELDGVETRLRWIVPGRFQMGSPEEEAGRWDDEGPRHEVTLTEGFWLGEVPCTQDLWQAVTGSNPSEFRSPRRPVENVSWDDVQEFLTVLGQKVPGLEPRLPTEAQWEHACRAGTEKATWLGDLEILGENNAPMLDEIAWYGGNSGVGFDLQAGRDTSDWEEKQYPHRLAGTREVALKRPNPWGLYDMLGNVDEWCSDYWADAYPVGPRIDPKGPDEGSGRVIRGGSWFDHARYVRAAFRAWYRPDERASDLGFRLSRGRGT